MVKYRVNQEKKCLGFTVPRMLPTTIIESGVVQFPRLVTSRNTRTGGV